MMPLKMLNLNNLFTKNFEFNYSQIKKDLEDDSKTYQELKKWFRNKQFDKKVITVYHPGAGSDLLTLLAMYDAIVSKKNKVANFIFIDMRDFYDSLIQQLEKYTHKPRITVKMQKKKQIITASYKDKKIRIIYYVSDFCNCFPKELENGIDIYYERAFEMFRAKDYITMRRIFSSMNKSGLMITDHSFDFASLKSKFKRLKGIPKKFGLYKNFQIWQRTSKD